MKPRAQVYDQYWKFAAERQEMFFRKLQGLKPPYTSDPILQEYKFCNVFRASDRVSQFLIKNVIYGFRGNEMDTLFRIFLFRLLNKIETWVELEKRLGTISLKSFTIQKYSSVLEEIHKTSPIYGNAFILCANKVFGYDRKHENHLALLHDVFVRTRMAKDLIESKSLEELFFHLRELPLIGNFMAYQLAMDFNYSEVFDFDENDFTVAGPGAVRGIRKCFLDYDENPTKTILSMVERQDEEFARLGLKFKNLFGRKLHAIDCQGLFCEVDKYSRVAFPALASNRVRIKTRYAPSSGRIDYFYPPKWGINGNLEKAVQTGTL